MTTDEIIAVVTGYKDGKVIECRVKNPGPYCSDKWTNTAPPAPSWDFSHLDYRVKPEPREWWIIRPKEGHAGKFAMFPNKAVAFIDRASGYAPENHEVLHVREVLEGES